MGFHYACDHDLAGFGGEVCELAHRDHQETALLPPTPIADLEKTLNIDPTQRLFRQVSACHQDFEIPAQALHEQVFFVPWQHYRSIRLRLAHKGPNGPLLQSESARGARQNICFKACLEKDWRNIFLCWSLPHLCLVPRETLRLR